MKSNPSFRPKIVTLERQRAETSDSEWSSETLVSCPQSTFISWTFALVFLSLWLTLCHFFSLTTKGKQEFNGRLHLWHLPADPPNEKLRLQMRSLSLFEYEHRTSTLLTKSLKELYVCGSTCNIFQLAHTSFSMIPPLSKCKQVRVNLTNGCQSLILERLCSE